MWIKQRIRQGENECVKQKQNTDNDSEQQKKGRRSITGEKVPVGTEDRRGTAVRREKISGTGSGAEEGGGRDSQILFTSQRSVPLFLQRIIPLRHGRNGY